MSAEAPTYDLRNHPAVAHDEWLAARTALLAKEKAFSKLRDELAQQRRDLPWERVEKTYVFDTPTGRKTLADAFGEGSQLIVYHFMFDENEDEGCKHCSFWADSFNPSVVHLRGHDTALAAVSRVPLAKIEAYRKRMGWSFPWLSSYGNDFKRDFGTTFTEDEIVTGRAFYNYRMGDSPDTEREGVSVFYKDPDGTIYHTYSAYARGIDLLNATYNFIDLTPKGRDEPEFPQQWVRRHDEYET
jgi:predicted dithiol-disulfide oxidoreductase (DUF899 family)